jgi:hypothetical protein
MKQDQQEPAVLPPKEVIGQPMPIRQLKSPPFRDDDLTAVLQSILEKHGGGLEVSTDQFTLYFPEGTVIQELYPRVNFARHRIKFTDSYEIMSTMDWKGNTVNISFPEEDIPDEIRRRYKR